MNKGKIHFPDGVKLWVVDETETLCDAKLGPLSRVKILVWDQWSIKFRIRVFSVLRSPALPARGFLLLETERWCFTRALPVRLQSQPFRSCVSGAAISSGS